MTKNLKTLQLKINSDIFTLFFFVGNITFLDPDPDSDHKHKDGSNIVEIRACSTGSFMQNIKLPIIYCTKSPLWKNLFVLVSFIFFKEL
jgi:hypothetical protein